MPVRAIVPSGADMTIVVFEAYIIGETSIVAEYPKPGIMMNIY